MSNMDRNSDGDWVYNNPQVTAGDRLKVEWARSGRDELVVNVGGSRAWVKASDLDDLFEAMRDSLTPPCAHCGGTGKQ